MTAGDVEVVDLNGAGQKITYTWLACDRCGQLALLRGIKVSRRCRMTPGCKGQHRPFEGPVHRFLAEAAAELGATVKEFR